MVADGKVYITNKKGLVIMAAGKEAKLLGNDPARAASYGTPVAANGTLFVTSQHSLWAVQTPPMLHASAASIDGKGQKTAQQ